VNILAKHLDETHDIQTYLTELKKNFLRDANYGIRFNGKELSLDLLVKVWFSTEFFHAGRKEQVQERQDWLTVLHDDAAHQLLAWGIINTAHTVKSLYACLKDLDREGSFTVNCPDKILISRNESE
jgi:hypothetical protein